MTDKIHLKEEKETLFITLYAKALDSRSKKSILNDKMADEMLNRIDYDFTKFKDINNNVVVIRAKQFDDWIKEFIGKNKNAVVLYLGCGLDTRITRINPPSYISWFDLDYPEVIGLRKNFYSNRNGYQMIGSPVTDLDWLEQIPKDRPVVIIAEGLLEYLTPQEVKKLLNGFTDHFVHGEIIFDVMNSFAIKSVKERLKSATGAVHKWAVDDVREVDKLNLKLKRITGLPLFKSVAMRKISFGLRLLFNLLSLIPAYRNMVRLMRYQF